MRRAILGVAAVMLATGFSVTTAGGPTADIEGLDELSKEKGRFKSTLVNPETDFSQYDGLYQETIRLQFRRQRPTDPTEETGSLIRSRSKGSSVPDKEDRVAFGKVVNSAVKEVLGSSEQLELVDEKGPGTLILQASILDIDSKIPTRSEGETELRGKLIAQGTVVFDLIDAETGVIQARMSERRKITRESKGPADFTILWSDIRQWAHGTATDLLREIEEARSEDVTAHGGEA